jgi:hypothetical protein
VDIAKESKATKKAFHAYLRKHKDSIPKNLQEFIHDEEQRAKGIARREFKISGVSTPDFTALDYLNAGQLAVELIDNPDKLNSAMEKPNFETLKAIKLVYVHLQTHKKAIPKNLQEFINGELLNPSTHIKKSEKASKDGFKPLRDSSIHTALAEIETHTMLNASKGTSKGEPKDDTIKSAAEIIVGELPNANMSADSIRKL